MSRRIASRVGGGGDTPSHATCTAGRELLPGGLGLASVAPWVGRGRGGGPLSGSGTGGHGGVDGG